MRFHILTLFPEILRGPFQESILGRAIARGLIEVHYYDIRSYTDDRHHTTDDYVFGGGSGMVMKVEPITRAVESARERITSLGSPDLARAAPVVLLSPQGRQLRQTVVEELSEHCDLVLICGHYEGVDERVREHIATDDISIGDYVLTGGEPAAIVLVDAVSRLVPGVVGDPGSVLADSHTSGLLQHPQYTRPREFQGWPVPDILLSGNHAEIARWRRQQALLRTLRNRPDMLTRTPLSQEDLRFLAGHGYYPTAGDGQTG